MLMSVSSILLSLSLFLGPQSLWASVYDRSLKLELIVQDIEKQCDRFECVAPYKIIPIWQYSKPASYSGLTAENKKILSRIAQIQAQVWGDTILEGDYVTEGQTRLDQVFAIYSNNQLQAYLMTYSEKAWDIYDCQYDGVRPSTLKNCLEGRIVESSYVAENFREYFYTMKTSARFLAKSP